MEYEVYIFAVTAVNQANEGMISATTMIRTDQACEL